ncbi:MAG TPA: crotonase/enoyl-CoA hydratase family protein [Sphingomonas sp.]|nr:crotonase/enoyl-CoA hydratase family protein [Sphingomonas sp.]
MTDRISLSVEGGVADVRLARPEKINALDEGMFAEIAAVQARLDGMAGVRAVVLSGEGRGFCVGIDLESLGSSPALRDLMPRTHGEANIFQNAAWGWRMLPVPVIAAVHGFAFGAGFQIMLGADIRIATPDAELSVMEMRWGLVPDIGGIALLRGLVRDDVARELTYSARRIAGDEGARLGLVTRLADDPHAEALAIARAIAAQSPRAVRAAKRLFNQSFDASAAQLLEGESREQELLLASAGHAETLTAARQGRAPVFEDEDWS